MRKVCEKCAQSHASCFSLLERDECVQGINTCDENALCFNTVGGHSCSCKPGYVGNGTVCKGEICALRYTLCNGCHIANVYRNLGV